MKSSKRNARCQHAFVHERSHQSLPPCVEQMLLMVGCTGITNIRNLQSRWWRQANRTLLTDPAHRCLVPFTAFAEPFQNPTWFVCPGVEVAYFAGVWQMWHGLRLPEQPGKNRREKEERDWSLFAFLTTEANDVVRPFHEKASPAILLEPEEQAEWLGGGEQSFRFQRPLPNEQLAVRSYQ